MAWQTPKTNWVATDSFNATDYNRIVNNLIYLHDMAGMIFPAISFVEMDGNQTFTSIPYARLYNAVEDNLEALNAGTFNLDIGEKKTFASNGKLPTFAEYNRIESACLALKEQLEINVDILPTLPQTLGNWKGVKV